MGKKKLKVVAETDATKTINNNNNNNTSSIVATRYWQYIYLDNTLEELEKDQLEAIAKILQAGRSGAKTQFSRRGNCVLHKLRANEKIRFVFASFENAVGRNLALVEKILDHKLDDALFYGEKNNYTLTRRVADKINRSKAYLLDDAFMDRLEVCLQNKKQEANISVPLTELPVENLISEKEEDKEQLTNIYFLDNKLIALNTSQIEFHKFLQKDFKDHYINFPLVITGPAGSGKTTLALIIAEKLQQQMLEERQASENQKPLRFLFVCKSKGLSDEIARIWKESGLSSSKEMIFDFLTYKELLKLQDPLLQEEHLPIDENSACLKDKNEIKVLLKDGKETFENWVKNHNKHHQFFSEHHHILYQELKICFSSYNDETYCNLGEKNHSLIAKIHRDKVVEIKNDYLKYLSSVAITPTKRGQSIYLEAEGKPTIAITTANADQFIKNHSKVQVTLVDAALQTLQPVSELYDVVCLDEGQDLSPNQIGALSLLCNDTKGKKLIINRDHHQSVGNDSVIAGNHLPFAHQTLYLHKSERTPQVVSEFSQEVLNLKSHVIDGQLEKIVKIEQSNQNESSSTKQQNNRAIYWLKDDNLSQNLPKEAQAHFKSDNRKLATIVMTEEMKEKLQEVEKNQEQNSKPEVKNKNKKKKKPNAAPVSTAIKAGNLYTPEEIKGLEFNYVLYYPFHDKEELWLKIYKLVKEDLQTLKTNENKHLDLRPHLTRFNQIDRELVVLLNEFFTAITRTKLCLVIVQSQDQRLNELYSYFTACIDQIQQNAQETPWGDAEMSIDDWQNAYKQMIKEDDNDEEIANFTKQLDLAAQKENNPEKKNALSDLLKTITIAQQTPILVKYIQSNQEQKIRLLFQDQPKFDLLQSFQIGNKRYANYFDYLMQFSGDLSTNVVKLIALHAKQDLIHAFKGTSKHAYFLQWMIWRGEQDNTFATMVTEVLREQVKTHGNVFITDLLADVIKEHNDLKVASFIFSWIEKNTMNNETIDLSLLSGLNTAAIELEKKPKKSWQHLHQSLTAFVKELVKTGFQDLKSMNASSTSSSPGLFYPNPTQQLTESGKKYLHDFVQPLLKNKWTQEEEILFLKKLQQLLRSAPCKQYLDAIVQIGTQQLPLKNALLNYSWRMLCSLCSFTDASYEAIRNNILYIGVDDLITKVEEKSTSQIKVTCCTSILTLVASKEYKRLLTEVKITPQQNQQIIQRLFKNGAEIASLWDEETSPWKIALDCENYQVTNLILKYEPKSVNDHNKSFLLYKAARSGHIETVEFLLKMDVNLMGYYKGDNPIGIASQMGHLDVVKLFLKYKAPVNNVDANGSTPLFLAAQEGHSAVVELLLTHNADVNQPYVDGSTAIFVASQNGHAEVVKLLIKYNADIDKRSTLGRSPLFIAVLNQKIEIVKLLLSAGANVNAPYIYSASLLLDFAQRINRGKEMMDFIKQQPGNEENIKLTVLELTKILGFTKIVDLFLNAKKEIKSTAETTTPETTQPIALEKKNFF